MTRNSINFLKTPLRILFPLALLVTSCLAFPDGAPGEACVRHKPNHGGKSQPLKTMPFSVTASSSTYKPGETVAVRIQGKYGKYFKGFFVQASDERGRWIGQFEPTDFSVSHPECAATTHHENREKEEITLVWHPPKDRSGTVRFLVSLIKTYKLYWVDAPALTPSSKQNKDNKTLEIEYDDEDPSQLSSSDNASDDKLESKSTET